MTCLTKKRPEWILILLSAMLPSCSLKPQTPRLSVKPNAPASPTLVTEAPIVVEKTAVPLPLVAKKPLKVRTASKNGIDLTIVSFDRRDYFLKVADQVAGPGSQYGSAEEAGKGNLASINGGFFTPEGKPVGLVVTGGESRGRFNSRSFIGTGILDGKKVKLMSRKNFVKSSEILQSGPRLVWHHEKLTGLSNNESRPRSFLLWDGQEHFALGYANSATLLGLAKTLKAQPIAGFDIKYALNLDGGRSSDLWASAAVEGGALTRRSFLNKKVRNYLVLKKR